MRALLVVHICCSCCCCKDLGVLVPNLCTLNVAGKTLTFCIMPTRQMFVIIDLTSNVSRLICRYLNDLMQIFTYRVLMVYWLPPSKREPKKTFVHLTPYYRFYEELPSINVAYFSQTITMHHFRTSS